MKKTLLAVLAVPLLFCACDFKNLTVPKEVEVKTGATYEFNLLKLDSKKQEWLDFAKYLDIGKMITGEGEGSGSSSEAAQFELLKYNDGGDYQQLLMHMGLQKIDFNIGDQLSNMDFSTQIQGFSVKEDIVIPNLTGLNQEKEIDLTNLQNTINSAVSFGGVSAPSLSVQFVSSSYFTSVEYTSGSIEITPLNDGELTGTVNLCNAEDVVVSSASFNNNKANLPLNGVIITKTGMKIKFTTPTGTEFKALIKNGVINTAEGVTIPDGQVTVTKPNVSFDMALSDNIKQCEINAGTIKVELITTGWTDGAIDIYPITISGGLDITIPDSNSKSLVGQVLKPSAIQATADVDLNLTGATIVFANPPKLKATLVINEITPTVQLPDSYQNSYNQPDISLEELAKYVTKISLNPSGFDVKVNNNLPAVAENKISLTMSSSFLGMASETKEFAAGTTTTEPARYRGTEQANKDIASNPHMDIQASIVLPGYDNGEKTITISNVAPGQTYGIDIEVTPVFDWTSAIVKLADAANTNIEGVFESNINKAEIFKAFGETFANQYADKIQFAKLPLYIYAQLPDLELFEHASFGGTIKAYYGKKDANPVKTPESEEKSLLNGNIKLVGMPELTQNSEGYVTANLGSGSINFEDAFNLQAPASIRDGDSLCLDYSIKLNGAGDGELEIFKTDLEKATDTSISIDIVLLLTLQFNVTEDIPINIMEIMKKDDGSGTPKTDQEKDLFKREQATSMDDYKKYIDVVKSAELEFAKPKFPIKSSGGMSLTVDWGGGERTECVLKDDVNAVIKVNPSTLLNRYPLEPAINLVIKKGDFGLPRQMDMEAKLKLRVRAEGTIPVYPFSEQEAN